MLFRLTARVGDKTRNIGLLLCCIFLVGMFFFRDRQVTVYNSTEILGSSIVFLMLLLSVNGEMTPVRWNKWVYYPMVLFGAGILLVSFIHPIEDGFAIYAIDLIFLFPAFYYVWICRGDHETLYNILSAALLICGMISFIFCIYLAFRGELEVAGGRVSGHKTNPNFLGMMGIAVLTAGIYLLVQYANDKRFAAVSAAGVGIGLSYTIISVSRTSMAAALLCILALLIHIIKRKASGIKGEKPSAFRIIALAAVIILVIGIGIKLNDINHAALEKNGTAAEQQENPDDTNEAENVAGRMDISEQTADSFGSGRIAIWSTYWRNTSLWGRPLSDIAEQLETLPETRAHNNFIDYYYRFGYIVGSIYLFYYIAMGITGLKILFSKSREKPRDLFVVMIIGTYSVFALIEIAMLPFIRLIPWIYFLSIAPIFEGGDRKREEQASH